MIRRLALGRYSLAFVGASIVTVVLLYGMAKVVELFERRNPITYFQITDIVLQPEDARPRRPARAAEQPDRGGIEFERPRVPLDIEQPSIEVDRPATAPVPRPQLEQPPAAD